ncbi:DUF2268 domain-containing putative Zn-dependent protease [Chromohalobacter sarecensis]|uniref:DUF2268 domain-containing putative Zn-dependent protease n=1 Tax=Chromohalobacter sarecensis TaxID=245294 RepID=A0ABV9CYB4_9GAMM|nr:DUF2268 domain-containing putative Zn-dependent protease [Chromohalobacter sarecensis]MCK0714796.1 DUF2268 domain-containing protein [Chromohalobacter sarecensis]
MIVPLFLDTNNCRHFSQDARRTIEEVCADAEPEIRSFLGDLNEDIELACQTGPFVIPETGEMGMAIAPGRVEWTVDARLPGGVAAVARAQLHFTLFHELHHLVRGWVMHGGAARVSFMEGVVSEGLATVFERDFGGRKTPWGQYPDEVEQWVAELLELPVSASYDHWMFQHPDGRRWIGYRAGTYIVDQAILASGLSAADLALVPSDEILRMSGIR